MASHWKSTERYWCKFCSDFVKDTKYDRKAHELSTKHQNAIQRSLKDIHKAKTQEDRDKQRAKDELARVNGIVSGKKPAGGIQGAADSGGPGSKGQGERPATAAERRAQMEQLVAMGIQLPGETTKEVTGVGEWEVVSQKVIETPVYDEESDVKKEEDSKNGILESSTSTGVRKRKVEEEEEDVRDEESMSKRKQQTDWGSKFKRYPVQKKGQVDDDLEALLSGFSNTPATPAVKTEATSETIKNEEPDEKPLAQVPEADASGKVVKQEESAPVAKPPVFKKRKSKR
ncbi:hypothetical protein MBLNU230_g4425t1 [Neophaeotheca triangularis]